MPVGRQMYNWSPVKEAAGKARENTAAGEGHWRELHWLELDSTADWHGTRSKGAFVRDMILAHEVTHLAIEGDFLGLGFSSSGVGRGLTTHSLSKRLGREEGHGTGKGGAENDREGGR